MVKYTEKEFKTILIVRKYIDSWFWDRYGVNPYQGCQFGCIYCDSRSARYRLPADFENDIIVKKDAAGMLDGRLSRARTLLPDVVAMSGASDPYHHAEARFESTRHCLEVLQKHVYPVHILTKSRLVLRDLDLLEEIGRNNWCCVSVTITACDPEVARFLEPKSPSPQGRFDVVRTIKENTGHVQSGVLLMPVIPCLSDSAGDLEAMVRGAKEAGADYVLFGGAMTMRDQQALWFLRHLKESHPEFLDKYEHLYGFTYDEESYEGDYMAKDSYNTVISHTFLDLCAAYDMPYRIRRFIPADYRAENYRIAEMLLNRAYDLMVTGKAWTRPHWAGMNIQNLKEPIVDVADRGELRAIRNVGPALEDFILKELGS
ncbi:MAG: radical SAM protein [Actinobacteria bacterium]|jgi:DNA repair photolyase|nr:MAG: radical SAM protein [Actinomycetota bacterium]